MSKKTVRRNLNRIRARHCYTMQEIASVLSVHVRTVQLWKKRGMQPLNPEDKRFLFEGSVVKDFLKRRLASRKCKLAREEFYCTKCQCARIPSPNTIELIMTGRKVGRGLEQIIVRALCESCGTRMGRFETERSISKELWSVSLQEGRKK